MTNIRFVAPAKLEDLLQNSNDAIYAVRKEYGVREIVVLLKEQHNKLLRNGPSFVLEEFDLFYGVLKNFSDLESADKSEAWKILFRSLSSLYTNLSGLLTESRSISEIPDKNCLCNTLKMTVFLYCYLMELFEEQETKDSNTIQTAKGKKKPPKKDAHCDWEREKERGVEALLKLFSLPLHRLFNPPVLEEEVVNCITKCCWKILEVPANTKKKDLMNHIHQLHGIAVERHRQSLGFCLKVIQLLQHKEQLVPTLAQLVEFIVKKYSQRIIITELMVEINRIDIKELSRDSVGTRAISAFLIDVAEKCPYEVMPSVSHILSFLEEEAYMMRNAALSVIGCLVSKVLSEEKIDLRMLHLRNSLLDKLEEHIHDMVGFTRGMALKVWSRLSDERKIPLTRLETLLPIVAGRLKDRVCYVRKCAVILLTSIMKQNPFAAKFPLTEIQEAYNDQRKKLKEMMSLFRNRDHEDPSADSPLREEENEDNDDDEDCFSQNKLEELMNEWKRLEPDLVTYWKEIESTSNGSEDSTNDDINLTVLSDCSDVNEVFKRFQELIKTKKFSSAFRLLKLLKDQWPDHELFAENGDEDSENPEEVPLPTAVLLCKRIFLDTSSLDSGVALNDKDVIKTFESATSVIVSKRGAGSAGTAEINQKSCSHEDLEQEVRKQQTFVRYLKDLVNFATEFKNAIPYVCTLLQSKNVTDVQEAINFFVSAYEFGIEGSIVGVRRMLVLVIAQEPQTREAVMDAYRRIYLQSTQLCEMNTRNKAIAVVKNLSELVQGATLGELISLEELVKHFTASGDINPECIKVMWERFAMKIPNTNRDDALTAVILISMVASSNCQVVRKNLESLIDLGLNVPEKDLKLAKNTCIALQKAVDNQGKIDLQHPPYRFPKTHIMFEKLSDLLVSTIDDVNELDWLPFSDEALKVIFLLAENPDWICEKIIKQMTSKLIRVSTANNENDRNYENGVSENVSESDAASENIHSEINSEFLARFISIVGSVALNMLIHLEINVFTELKIRNALKEESGKRRSTISQKTPKPRRSTMMSPRTPGGGDEEDIGLAGAAAMEDAEVEFINQLCNEEIVEKGNNSENLLAKLSHVVVAVASDPIRYPDMNLRASATLSLAKFMAVSEKFCNKHLQLLFTIMEKSTEPLIRANTIIAIGDLCYRYPNLLDPWTPQLYSPLRDRVVMVRTNTLKVLSRLILSDMIKVKGQISEMAQLLVDEELNLVSMARVFFTDLGKKQNAIYNVLPDIISRLSDIETGTEEDSFRQIMKYLFDLIEKDRQVVCLVEKLCQRFRATTNERQWRDLAYCLSLLTYSEKSIAKMYENMICFADKLSHDAVYESISSIIAATRKIPNMKNELKQMLDEFEQKIVECRARGVNEDDGDAQQVVTLPKTLTSASKRPAKSAKKSAKKKPTKKVITKSYDFSEDEEDDDFEPQVKINERGADRTKRDRKQRIAKLFEDSDSDE